MSAPEHHEAAVTFSTMSARQLVSCRVCGRTLLMGERSVGYFTASGEGPYDVCQLCVPRAHRYGLRPRPSTADEVSRARGGGPFASLAATMKDAVSGRARTRSRRSISAQPQGSATAAAQAAAAGAPAPGRRRRRRSAAAPLDPLALGVVPAGSAAIPVAVAAFNQSPHARTLAGLYRTLGAPRASVVPRSASDREVILTVAWEIVWYQFRVMPDGIEQQRGQYLSELAPRWQQWNCTVVNDGTVREAGDVDAPSGQDPATTIPVEALPR